MSPAELLQVGGTRSNDNITTNAMEINAVTTRSNRDKPHRPNKEYGHPREHRKEEDYEQRPKTKYCPACGTYGHTEEKCPAAGKILHIT
jgi:hypothetical protein